jgi:hypothetical protein
LLGEARKWIPGACRDRNNNIFVIGFARSDAQTTGARFTEKEKRLSRLCSSVGFRRDAGKGEAVRRWYPVYVRAETAAGKGGGVEQQS